MKGITKGRNSLEAVTKQIRTKLKNGNISSVSAKTAGKIAGWQMAGHIENAPGDALEDDISGMTDDSGEDLGTGSGSIAGGNSPPKPTKCQGL